MSIPRKPSSTPAPNEGRIRTLGLEQVALMDQLESALQADDQPRVMELERRIVGLEKEVERQ